MSRRLTIAAVVVECFAAEVDGCAIVGIGAIVAIPIAKPVMGHRGTIAVVHEQGVVVDAILRSTARRAMPQGGQDTSRALVWRTKRSIIS